MHLEEVHVPAAPLDRLEPVIGSDRLQQLGGVAKKMRDEFDGRTVWNVNSTATGGGVAEMLQVLLAYIRGADLDARWLVIKGDPAFYAITKRLHNGLHGAVGDQGPLGVREQEHYARISEANAEELHAQVRAGDVVILHDPQTAGLVGPMRRAGAVVVWRCHIGSDHDNDVTRGSWEFLRPFLEDADAYVFSRSVYVPDFLPANRAHVIPPSIDPFSAKNQEMDPATVRAVLAHVGLIGGDASGTMPTFHREDGSPARVDHCADIVRTGPPPPPDAPFVVQVSRWDRLKDMAGVMRAFARHVNGASDAHLALVGPNVSGVADDPEGGEVLNECFQVWRDLPHRERERIQLACVPMHDLEENAAIINAVQRHATVVVQKSLAEGFGLTVAEAMWKSRPVVASAVGGISDQIVHGESGLLLGDPTDSEAFGEALRSVLSDGAYAQRLGRVAHQRVNENFLGDRHLRQWAELFEQLRGA